MFNINLNRNTKIDLASALVGAASLIGVFESDYLRPKTAVQVGLTVMRHIGFTVLGAEVLKRVVNGPQDSKVTTVVTEDQAQA